MAVQMQDRRLPVHIRKMADGSFQMKQTWAKDHKARQWRPIPGEGLTATEVRERIEGAGYRVEWAGGSPNVPDRRKARY